MDNTQDERTPLLLHITGDSGNNPQKTQVQAYTVVAEYVRDKIQLRIKGETEYESLVEDEEDRKISALQAELYGLQSQRQFIDPWQVALELDYGYRIVFPENEILNVFERIIEMDLDACSLATPQQYVDGIGPIIPHPGIKQIIAGALLTGVVYKSQTDEAISSEMLRAVIEYCRKNLGFRENRQLQRELCSRIFDLSRQSKPSIRSQEESISDLLAFYTDDELGREKFVSDVWDHLSGGPYAITSRGAFAVWLLSSPALNEDLRVALAQKIVEQYAKIGPLSGENFSKFHAASHEEKEDLDCVILDEVELDVFLTELKRHPLPTSEANTILREGLVNANRQQVLDAGLFNTGEEADEFVLSNPNLLGVKIPESGKLTDRELLVEVLRTPSNGHTETVQASLASVRKLRAVTQPAEVEGMGQYLA